MASLWIREFAEVGNAPSASAGAGNIAVPKEPGTDQAVLSFTTTAQSAAFGTTTKFIRIYSSADFHYVVAANPTATTAGMKGKADTYIDLGVTAGHKIAAVTA